MLGRESVKPTKTSGTAYNTQTKKENTYIERTSDSNFGTRCGAPRGAVKSDGPAILYDGPVQCVTDQQYSVTGQ